MQYREIIESEMAARGQVMVYGPDGVAIAAELAAERGWDYQAMDAKSKRGDIFRQGLLRRPEKVIPAAGHIDGEGGVQEWELQ